MLRSVAATSGSEEIPPRHPNPSAAPPGTKLAQALGGPGEPTKDFHDGLKIYHLYNKIYDI